MGYAMVGHTQEIGWAGWRWKPDTSRWFVGVGVRALSWSPPPTLGLEAEALRAALYAAATRNEQWLVHPCISTLLQGGGSSQEGHARLAAWIALNTDKTQRHSLGGICLSHDTWLWAQDGPYLVEAGTHKFESLPATDAWFDDLALPDPWGDSLPDTAMAGDIGDATWWVRLPLSASDEPELASDIRNLLVTQRLLSSLLPTTSNWVRAVTRVVVPLVRSRGDEFRSGSIAGIPGLVFVEMTHKQLLVLEALVHESAHLHFHIAEFDNGFIVAGHDARYASPLRPDPRPLRGIFLAYHALVYMCAFYKDWQRSTDDVRAVEALYQLLQHRAAAGELLCAARANLTSAGNAFLSSCLKFAEADDRRSMARTALHSG